MSENISVALRKDGKTDFEYKHRFKLEWFHERLINLECPDWSIKHIQDLALWKVHRLALIFMDWDLLQEIPRAEIM